MPIVSGFVVPKMNPTSHVGNIRLLRPVVVTVEHQEDSQAENNESKDKEGKHSKKCTLYAVGFDCSFALAITIKP